MKPCLLIPIYNHGQTIRFTVEELSRYELPIFVVDDGSDLATQTVLATLALEFPLLQLFRLPHNAGKGAAVMRGLREAFAAGFSHALQIDADGQHNAADVPRFLEVGSAHPEAVVCGRPIYDTSIPKGRLYGRAITHFWVGVETLSFKVSDAMCGFRLYPLDATCALIDRVDLPTRMDFDIEILVRLVWAGLRCENVETRVVYPPDGVSHFDLLRDNLRISKMHTRLSFGMLFRLPKLLWQKSGRCSSGDHWSRLAERGTLLGLRTVFVCYRLLGARAARWMLYPVVGYFFLTGRAARAASLDYLRRVGERKGNGIPAPGWRASYRHMLAFGQSGLDKLAAWMGELDRVPVDFPNRAEFDRLAATGRGVVLIGSHLGNLEMTRALANQQRQVTINAVVFSDHALHFNSLLQQINSDFGVNLIQVSQLGPDTAIALKAKIDQGEWVVIVGDRTPPAEASRSRVTAVDFLGAPAPFAHGPFILASLLECPAYLFFCLREKTGYTIHLEPFAERVELPRSQRRERLADYIQRYARRLEYHCLNVPEQWFNFYDFWQHDVASPVVSTDKA